MTTVAVVVASAGRPELLAEAIESLSAQTAVDFVGVASVPDELSLPTDRSLLGGWKVLTGVRGAAAQRNAGLDAVQGVDVVAFFDDDSVVRADYLANALRFLDTHPGYLGLTGHVLIDGATAGEVDRETAAAALAGSATAGDSGRWRPSRELYGCNFVVRMSGAPHLRFDDRLPLYSWLEDHDFARRLMKFGPLARLDDCVIVHRGVGSGGRQAHMRLGYSQVMNPIYLARKGSFPVWLAAEQLFRPTAKNALLSVGGSSAAWRRERLRGNGVAARDIFRGRITPERIVDL
jgi:GT2 family glycosyltransferase